MSQWETLEKKGSEKGGKNEKGRGAIWKEPGQKQP